MALEYSEIMAATAMFYTNRELDAACETEATLIEWIGEAKNKAQNDVDYGSSKNAFVEYMGQKSIGSLDDKKKQAILKNALQGISAAQAIKVWLNRDHGEKADVKAIKCYLTGNIWPTEVADFKVNAFGFDDYNSSDFIVKTKDKKFYGCSLKKKPKENSADPTLINKAFTSIIDGPGPGGIFDKIKKEIDIRRTEYFANRVRDAVEEDILVIPEWDKIKDNDEELFRASKRNKKIFKYAYIDTKGNAVDGYNTEPAQCKALSMKEFVNKDLARKNNKLYEKFIEVTKDHGELFANSLINLVLKVNLYEELSANNKLKDYSFGFALVTGVGSLTKVRGSKPARYTPTLGRGKAIDLHTVLCGLTDLAANKKPYVVKVDEFKKGLTDAAKVFFTISKDDTPILTLELRYKGKFTPQPQFFANITPEFKTIMTEKCLVKNPDGNT